MHISDTITASNAFEEEICFTNAYLLKHKVIWPAAYEIVKRAECIENFDIKNHVLQSLCIVRLTNNKTYHLYISVDTMPFAYLI